MKSIILVLTITICISVVSCTNNHKQFQPETTQYKELPVIGGKDTIANIKISSMQTAKGQTSLKEHGVQLTLQMSQLANNQEYLNLCSNSKDVNKVVSDISQCKFNIPEKVFCISHLQSSLKMSAKSCPEIFEKLIRSIPSQLNALSGSALLAATSLLVSEDAFIYEMSLKEPVIYLYHYKGDWQSMVIFRPIHDGIVLANSYFVHHSMLNEIKNSSDVKSFFSDVLRMDKVYVQECK